MKKFLGQIFQDEKGNYSSNRFVGILCGVTLCVTLYANSFSHGDVKPSDVLVQAVTALSFGALGLGAANKIFGKKSNDDTQA
jgi:2C-methyl-D-erythritol 2,4-cyclodiphosphate synthase